MSDELKAEMPVSTEKSFPVGSDSTEMATPVAEAPNPEPVAEVPVEASPEAAPVESPAAPVESPVVSPVESSIESSVKVEAKSEIKTFRNKPLVEKVWVDRKEFPRLSNYVELEFADGSRNRVLASEVQSFGIDLPPNA